MNLIEKELNQPINESAIHNITTLFQNVSNDQKIRLLNELVNINNVSNKNKLNLVVNNDNLNNSNNSNNLNNLNNLVNQKGCGINDPDIIYYDDWEIDAHPEDELPQDELFDGTEDEIINNIFKPFKGDFEGYDVGGISEELTESMDQSHGDVGVWGKARGRIYSFDEFDNDEYITINQKPKKSKILKIQTIDDFDTFTSKYGFIKNDMLYISWDKVANKYKGFYLSSSSQGARTTDVPFGDKTFPNWVDNDYGFIDNVILFDKLRELFNYKEIKEPFKAKLVEPISIPYDDFINIFDPITSNKILFIDNIKAFDKFTNLFGLLRKKNKIQYISINWRKVNKLYDGFLIDIDNDFLKDREDVAFFKGEKYESWVNRNGLGAGIVYVFD